MHFQRSVTVLLSTFAVLLVYFVAGCGGEEQSGNGSQDGGSGGAQKQGGEGSKQEISAPKIALGTVTRVDAEAERIILRPSSEEQGKKPLRFKVSENTTITLDDEEAELSDAKKGQQAQITYVVKDGRNLARKVALINAGG